MKSEPGRLKYQSADPRWSIFGINDFETYVEKFVLQGRFHNKVPEKIVDAYSIAEHVLAGAYFHYPLIDEALVKLLRFFELSVKMRCRQLGIDPGRKTLFTLIDIWAEAEHEKELKDVGHSIRWRRNFMLHPDGETLGGTGYLNQFKLMMSVWNAMFLPVEYFKESKRVAEYFQGILGSLNPGNMQLEINQSGYLIYQSRLVEVYKNNDEWTGLLAFYPIPPDIHEITQHQRFPSPIFAMARSLQKIDNAIHGINFSNEQFVLKPATNPDFLNIIGAWTMNINHPENGIILSMYNKFLNTEVYKEKLNCRYQFWGRDNQKQPVSL